MEVDRSKKDDHVVVNIDLPNTNNTSKQSPQADQEYHTTNNNNNNNNKTPLSLSLSLWEISLPKTGISAAIRECWYKNREMLDPANDLLPPPSSPTNSSISSSDLDTEVIN